MARFNLEELLGQTALTPDGCMEWSRARSRGGYGQKGVNGKVVYVHRIVCELAHGEPQPGYEVLHSCDNPPCINPAHLRWGTRAENVADMVAKGRAVRNPITGEAHHSTHLTAAQVKEIRSRRESGALLRELSADYGVSIAAIHNIVTGTTWKEIA